MKHLASEWHTFTKVKCSKGGGEYYYHTVYENFKIDTKGFIALCGDLHLAKDTNRKIGTKFFIDSCV